MTEEDQMFDQVVGVVSRARDLLAIVVTFCNTVTTTETSADFPQLGSDVDDALVALKNAADAEYNARSH